MVRIYASQPSKFSDENKEAAGRSADFRPDSIPASAGLNRTNWNLFYEAPDLVDGAIIWGFTGGPAAIPGDFQVRLTLGDYTQTESFELMMDPRQSITVADLEEQFDMLLRIRSMLQESHDAIREIRSVRGQMKEQASLAEEAGFGDEFGVVADSASTKLTGVEQELMQTKNQSFQDALNFPPMLDNQIAALYGYVLSTDDRPNQGAYDRLEDLQAELSVHVTELRRIIQTDVARFNQMLQDAGVPPVVVKQERAISAVP